MRSRWTLAAVSTALFLRSTLAGVGIAVSGTVLEMLQRSGSSTGTGIAVIIGVLAAVLLPAGVLVMLIGAAPTVRRWRKSG